MTKRLLENVALGVASLCLWSCSATRIGVVAEPPRGEVRTARIGDTLIKATSAAGSPAFNLRFELTAKSVADFTTTFVTIQPGLLRGKLVSPHDECYVIDQPITLSPDTGDTEVSEASLCFGGRGSSFVLAIMEDGFNVSFFPVGPIYGERTVQIDSSAPSFTQELIYDGTSGETVKVTYRELSNGKPDPATTRVILCDLSKSQLIEVSGARLAVAQATNTTLTYKALAHFRPMRSIPTGPAADSSTRASTVRASEP
jgi:hypothetical protein